jgi:hypothetical protein
MESAHLANSFDPRPQIEMISIAQQDLDTEILQHVLRDAFDRTERSYGHEYRRLNFSMGSYEFASTRRAAGRLNLQVNRHRGILT